MHSTAAIASLLSLATYVSAHGFITAVSIGGTSYPGANGQQANPSASPLRAVASGSPVQDLTSSDLTCGLSAQLAPKVATANAGDLMQFTWSGETGIPWFHNVGPIQTYMTQCQGSCSSFTPSSSTNWFKISELGEKEPGTPDTWIQQDLNSGAPANVTLPSNLPTGDYLVRHEILALQNGQSQGGAEFYPACMQISVTGSGSATPDSTVNFPGAYSPTDPGVLVNIYNPGVNYVFPGGDVSNIASSLTGSSDVADGGSSAPPPSSPAPSSSSAPVNPAPVPSSSSPAASPSSTSGSSCAPSKAKRMVKKNHNKRRLDAAIY